MHDGQYHFSLRGNAVAAFFHFFKKDFFTGHIELAKIEVSSIVSDSIETGFIK